MEHSGLHPEFGLFSPTPRLRRELRIAAVSLLFGASRARFAYPASAPFAIRTTQRRRSLRLRMLPRPRRVNPAPARARMRARPAPRVTPA